MTASRGAAWIQQVSRLTGGHGWRVYMTIGAVFSLMAMIVFLFLGAGIALLPRAEYWAWFCLA